MHALHRLSLRPFWLFLLVLLTTTHRRASQALRVGVVWRVILPLTWKSIVSAFSLTFANTMGEFGVILMIGGNIPGSTQTASIAVYDLVEQMRYQDAHLAAGILLAFSFALLFLLSHLQSPSSRTQRP